VKVLKGYFFFNRIDLKQVEEMLRQPGANAIKLFTKVIYHHSMVIMSFCVIKLYYLGNYHGMAVNIHGKTFL
jgi:hypothetical protein